MADPPAPPFRFSRESRIRIDREGRFWHEGQPIEHKGLTRAFASWLTIDPESDRYMLRNERDWCFITVDDTPIVVRSCSVARDAVTLSLSDGTDEALDAATLRIDADDVPYCDVHGGRLPARFSRHAAFALTEALELDRVEEATLVVGSDRYPVRRVARGKGGPVRAPAHPEA